MSFQALHNELNHYLINNPDEAIKVEKMLKFCEKVKTVLVDLI